MAATGITLFLIAIISAYSLAILRTARRCTLADKGQCVSGSVLAVAAVITAVAPILLLLVVQRQIGYYTAALIWTPLLLAVAFASPALCWCLAALLTAMAVLGGLQASTLLGIASLLLYWTVCLLSLHILSHRRNHPLPISSSAGP